MKQRLVLSALGIYCALLIAAGWPVTATHQLTDEIARRAEAILSVVTIEPGLRLFYRPYDEVWKMRRQCFHLRFFGQDNAFLKGLNIGEGCETGYTFKLAADPLGMLLFRFFEEAALERLHQVQAHGEKAWRDESFRHAREASLYSVVGEHFCHSKEFVDLGTQRLVMGWWRTEINYKTNETRENYFVTLDWTCTRHGISSLHYQNIPAELLSDLARK